MVAEGMIPLAGGAIALAMAAAGGAWVGWDFRDAQAGRERAAALADATKTLERAMEAREAARLAVAAVSASTQAALQKALNAQHQQPPIKCPPSGDVGDALLPGVADGLRSIRAAGGRAAAGVDPVQPAGDPGR
jgi:hypothetical protein